MFLAPSLNNRNINSSCWSAVHLRLSLLLHLRHFSLKINIFFFMCRFFSSSPWQIAMENKVDPKIGFYFYTQHDSPVESLHRSVFLSFFLSLFLFSFSLSTDESWFFSWPLNSQVLRGGLVLWGDAVNTVLYLQSKQMLRVKMRHWVFNMRKPQICVQQSLCWRVVLLMFVCCCFVETTFPSICRLYLISGFLHFPELLWHKEQQPVAAADLQIESKSSLTVNN